MTTQIQTYQPPHIVIPIEHERRLSNMNKRFVISLATIGVISLLAGLFFLWHCHHSHCSSKVRDLSIMATIFGSITLAASFTTALFIRCIPFERGIPPTQLILNI